MMSSLKGSGSIFSASRSLRSSFSLSLVSYWSCLSDSEGLIHWDVQMQTQMTDTHWRCWPETRPSLRSSTSPPGTGAPSPSWPGRSPGSPGGSRPWSGAELGSSFYFYFENKTWQHGPVKWVWLLVPSRTADCGLRGTPAQCQHQQPRHQGSWIMLTLSDSGSLLVSTWSRQHAVQNQTQCCRFVAQDRNSSSDYAVSYLE